MAMKPEKTSLNEKQGTAFFFFFGGGDAYEIRKQRLNEKQAIVILGDAYEIWNPSLNKKHTIAILVDTSKTQKNKFE